MGCLYYKNNKLHDIRKNTFDGLLFVIHFGYIPMIIGYKSCFQIGSTVKYDQVKTYVN